ncbi:MAG: triose-phosphate isomerase [Patescibacteria group bacterium]|nr:triose-phosphate isomerase [Patescibacteria group bacterium]
MKKFYIIANWKMKLNFQESIELFNEIKQNFLEKNQAEIVVCPSYVPLFEINKNNIDRKIKLGGQDVFWEETGAYTGEISCEMLEDVGCEYVIIGHSDRRKYFKETDEMAHYKVKTALKSSLTPILCVGENFQERQENRKDYVIISQITKALSGIDFSGSEKMIIAYEPVWVIGSGQAIKPEDAEYMHQIIKQTLIDIFPIEIVEKCFKIIYGGSINAGVVKNFLIQPNIWGVLVGSDSLNSKKFIDIIREVNTIK